MGKFAALIAFVCCAGLVRVGLAAMIWISAELLAFASHPSWAATSSAALNALGWH